MFVSLQISYMEGLKPSVAVCALGPLDGVFKEVITVNLGQKGGALNQ